MNRRTKSWIFVCLAICLIGAIMIPATFFTEYGDAILETKKSHPLIIGFIVMILGAIFTVGATLGAFQKRTPPTNLQDHEIRKYCRKIYDLVLSNKPCAKFTRDQAWRLVVETIQSHLRLESKISTEWDDNDGPPHGTTIGKVINAKGKVLKFL